MAYANHVRVSFGGTLGSVGSSAEIWNCSVNVVRPPDAGSTTAVGGILGYPVSGGATEPYDAAAHMESVAPALATWFAASTNGMADSAALTFLKVNAIGPDGKYASAFGTNVHDYATPVAGTAAQKVVDILSLAISWTTGHKRGPGARGRIYLPNYGYDSFQQMRVPNASATAAAAAGKRLLVVLADAGNTKGRVLPCISSKVDASNSTILGVRVGDVWDVQRRRKNALKETYQTLAV